MSSPSALSRMDIDPVWLMRILSVIPVVLILLAGSGAVWMYFFILSLLPEGHSEVDIHRLTADVTVLRDGNGVPGIIGRNEEDVGLVFGYVMAQDRLWQMDVLRKASQGRLAEIFGKQYLDGDHVMRTLKAGADTCDVVAKLRAHERSWLESFVKGVNLYLSTHSGKLPVEFSLLEYRPEPFTEDDVLGLWRAMAWESSTAARVDPVMLSILARLGKERARVLWPTDPAVSPDLGLTDLGWFRPESLMIQGLADRRAPFRVPGLRGGAVWAVSGSQTQSGRPMTACTLNQSVSAPGFWYWAR
ncbi:MAG: penicillin acylase family protein, partial [Pseudomonadota bacterium]